MLDLNHNIIDDDIEFKNFDFSFMPFEQLERQRPPFFPGGSTPPPSNFPPDFESPPGFNFPGGTFNPPGMPKSPPPKYIPNKNAAGVQSFGPMGGNIETQAVSPRSIRFCLYKYTYIWERSGRSYWTFLLNVDRRTASGFRWTGRRWVYFGVDLRRIDSFICYRTSFEDDCEECNNFRQGNKISQSSKKEYLLNETRDVYAQTLISADVPEIEEDFVTQTIGYIDDDNIKSDLPCLKIRNIGYRITLEVAYPTNFDKDLKNTINQLASEACNDAYVTISSTRNNEENFTPLENFNSSLSLIPETLKSFSDSFNSKLEQLNLSSDISNNITCSIRNEKINSNWKPYFYNNAQF